MQKLGSVLYIIVSISIILAAGVAIKNQGFTIERGVIIFSSAGGLMLAISLLRKE